MRRAVRPLGGVVAITVAAFLLLVCQLGPAAAESATFTRTAPFHGQISKGSVLAVAGCSRSQSNSSFNSRTGVVHGYASASARFPNTTTCAWPYSNATAGFWGTLTTTNLTTTTAMHHVAASWTISYLVRLDPGTGSFQSASAEFYTVTFVHDLTNGTYLPWQFPEWTLGWQAASGSSVYAGISNGSVFLNYSLVATHTYQIIVVWDVTVFVWSQGALASASLNLTGPSHYLKLDSLRLT